MAAQNRESILTIGWLEHLEQGLEQSVRQRDVRAIRTALGIAKRRMKLQRDGSASPGTSGALAGGFPITIFNDAIREMDKRRGGQGDDDS